MGSRINTCQQAYGCMKSVLFRWLSVALLIRFCAAVPAQLPDTPRTEKWVANGAIHQIVSDGVTAYFGGSFTVIGLPSGTGVPVDITTGAPIKPYPFVNGGTAAVVSDGADGWYIGGGFTSVGGVGRNQLAHILADGSLDLQWNPNPTFEVYPSTIYSLALDNGSLFVGGHFDHIGGADRQNIAELDAGSGLATSWNPGCNSYLIDAIVPKADKVYVAGNFTVIGGVTAPYLAAVGRTSGTTLPFAALPDEEVTGIAVSDTAVYAVGSFTTMRDEKQEHIAKLDASTGAVDPLWQPFANVTSYFNVNKITVFGSVVYVSGEFDQIGGASRQNLAGLDALTVAATPFMADGGDVSGIETMLVSNGKLYIGGRFSKIGAVSRRNVAAIDLETSQATSWSPGPDDVVTAIASNESSVFVGGSFGSVGGVERNHLAAVNVASGELTSWNPDLEGDVMALKLSGTTVYVGGNFSKIGGQIRENIAAIDADTGNPTAWNPHAGDYVNAIDTYGNNVYITGNFTSAGGVTRNHVAALDCNTALATNWNPNADFEVNAIKRAGSVVYASGPFYTIGGQSRIGIAALDATSGLATGFVASADLVAVGTIAVTPAAVYVGGLFRHINGVERLQIASLDPITGAVLPWNPVPGGGSGRYGSSIGSIIPAGNTIYVAGNFGGIDETPRPGLAAIDAASGLLMSWNPAVAFSPSAICLSGSTLFAGGGTRIELGSHIVGHFSQFGEATPLPTGWMAIGQ